MPVLDLTHLRCPDVVLALKDAMVELPAGTSINVIAADPLAAIDIPLFALKNGYSCEREGEDLAFRIGKSHAKV